VQAWSAPSSFTSSSSGSHPQLNILASSSKLTTNFKHCSLVLDYQQSASEITRNPHWFLTPFQWPILLFSFSYLQNMSHQHWISITQINKQIKMMIIENGHQKLRCSNHGGGLNIVIELASYL